MLFFMYWTASKIAGKKKPPFTVVASKIPYIVRQRSLLVNRIMQFRGYDRQTGAIPGRKPLSTSDSWASMVLNGIVYTVVWCHIRVMATVDTGSRSFEQHLSSSTRKFLGGRGGCILLTKCYVFLTKGEVWKKRKTLGGIASQTNVSQR